VMQSRDMGESILSQFLPPDVHQRLSAVGPSFNDKVVNDIASILRRPCPSQDDLVRGLQTLSDKDSVNDDIWPADGSHRPRDELLPNSVPSIAPTAGFSSFSYSKTWPELQGTRMSGSTTNVVGQGPRLISTSSTTMADSGSFSIPAVSLSFITANDQMKAEKLAAATGTTSAIRTNPKPQAKGRQTDRNQSDISRFFGRETSKLPLKIPSQSTGHQLSPWKPSSIDLDQVLPQNPLVSKATTIPIQLSSHKLPTKAAPFKRPRAAFEERPSPNRKRYVYLSSSPTRDSGESPSIAPVIDENASTSKIPVKDGTTASTAHPISLTRPATTMHITSMAMLRQGGTGRKTLGVRRTMNGWDNRWNK